MCEWFFLFLHRIDAGSAVTVYFSGVFAKKIQTKNSSARGDDVKVLTAKKEKERKCRNFSISAENVESVSHRKLSFSFSLFSLVFSLLIMKNMEIDDFWLSEKFSKNYVYRRERANEQKNFTTFHHQASNDRSWEFWVWVWKWREEVGRERDVVEWAMSAWLTFNNINSRGKTKIFSKSQVVFACRNQHRRRNTEKLKILLSCNFWENEWTVLVASSHGRECETSDDELWADEKVMKDIRKS